MLTSAGPTADVSRPDPPGDIMMTSAYHVARSGAATCHPYVFSSFDNYLLIPKNDLFLENL